MDNEIPLTLHPTEVNFLLAVLGDLPTKSNAFPLLQKIAGQTQAAQQAHAAQDRAVSARERATTDAPVALLKTDPSA